MVGSPVYRDFGVRLLEGPADSGYEEWQQSRLPLDGIQARVEGSSEMLHDATLSNLSSIDAVGSMQ